MPTNRVAFMVVPPMGKFHNEQGILPPDSLGRPLAGMPQIDLDRGDFDDSAAGAASLLHAKAPDGQAPRADEQPFDRALHGFAS